MNDEKLRHAPWTPEQVARLNAYQQHSGWHPFTCGSGISTPEHSHVDLVATENGWVCPKCNYTQDWCHDFMVEVDWTDKNNQVA